jgi:hypothetical protein
MSMQKTFPIVVGTHQIQALVIEKDGFDWIAIKPICAAIGVDHDSQRTKLRNNPQFNCGDITAVGFDGKSRQMVCLPLRQVTSWLTMINANKVKAEARGPLLSFQEGCQDVLTAAVFGTASGAEVAELKRRIDSVSTQITEFAIALAHEKRMRLAAEEKLEQVSRHQATAGAFQLHARRVMKRPLTLN